MTRHWYIYQCEDCHKFWIDTAGMLLQCAYCDSKNRTFIADIDPETVHRTTDESLWPESAIYYQTIRQL
jgi:hypothetical protein